MPKFSDKSLAILETCHPDLQLVLKEAIEIFDFSVLDGHRDESKQNQAFSEKKSKVKFPNSAHNKYPSMAVDIAPYPIDWTDTPRFCLLAGTIKGIAKILKDQGVISHSIRWGGDWNSNNVTKDESFIDSPHFELV